MDKNNQFQIIAFLRDKVSESDFLMVLNRLKHADDQAMTAISMIAFKNILVTALLGFFLGAWGINRFYVGAVTSGVAKLLTGVFIIVLMFVPVPFSLFYLPILLLLAYGIFNIIDIFLCIHLAKKKNFRMVMNVLELNGSNSNNFHNGFSTETEDDVFSDKFDKGGFSRKSDRNAVSNYDNNAVKNFEKDAISNSAKPIDEVDIVPDIFAVRAVDVQRAAAKEEPSVAKKIVSTPREKNEDIIIKSDAVIDVSKLQNNKSNGTNKN